METEWRGCGLMDSDDMEENKKENAREWVSLIVLLVAVFLVLTS
jgi:hypothetical protein